MCYLFFLVLFLVGFLILSWRHLDWAVMLIIAGLPLYLARFKVIGLPMTLLEAMILIAFFCWLIFYARLGDFFRGKYKIKDFIKNSPWSAKGSAEGRVKYPFGLEIVLLLVVSFVAVGVAHFSADALGIWKAYFFEPALLYILVLNVFSSSSVISSAARNPLKLVSWLKRFLVADAPRNDKDGGINKIGLSLAIGAFAVSVYAIFQKITGFGIANPLWAAEATRRVVSFFGYPNAVGLYLAPLIPVLLAFLSLPRNEYGPLEKKMCFPLKKENISVLGLSRGFLGFIILLSLAAIYFAHSEGAIVGLAAAFVVCGLLGNKKTRLAVLAFVMAAAIAVSFAPNGFKVVEQKLTLHDFSGQVRRAQWAETWQMLKADNHWLFGAGLANYQNAIAPYHVPGIFYDDGMDSDFRLHVVFNDDYKKMVWRPVEIYLYPHNIFLNFWSEFGLAGALLFLWIFGRVIYHLLFLIYRSKKNNNKESLFLTLGLLGAIVVIIVHGLVDVPYFKNDLAGLFWILIALLVLLRLKLTTSEKSIK